MDVLLVPGLGDMLNGGAWPGPWIQAETSCTCWWHRCLKGDNLWDFSQVLVLEFPVKPGL